MIALSCLNWDDYAMSSPVSDVEDALLMARQTTGAACFDLRMTWRAWRLLRRHPDVLRLCGYGPDGLRGRAPSTMDELASLLAIESCSLFSPTEERQLPQVDAAIVPGGVMG